MVFCNGKTAIKQDYLISHNPYFNRWFSAIKGVYKNMYVVRKVTILILIDGFLQYEYGIYEPINYYCHNPYFNRWFSAMSAIADEAHPYGWVTILILIDGFLQCNGDILDSKMLSVTILILIDGFLQYQKLRH